MVTLEEHQASHDSRVSPVSGCEHCKQELRRRTHKCFGDGESTTPVPQKVGNVDND